MEVSPDLKKLLKSLKLGPVLATLPDRAALAKQKQMSYLDFLEMVLSDEVERREHGAVAHRVAAANFEGDWSVERLDWDVPVRFDRELLKDLFSLGFIERAENVTFTGPVGVGKSCWAEALGRAACRARRQVIFTRADPLLKDLHRARADHTFEAKMRRFIVADLLIIDDFALKRMGPQESSDFYEIVIERHTRASTILTSNRSIDEWVATFDDPILANSALDRLAHHAHQIVIEGESLRPRKAPRAGQKNEEPEGESPGRRPRRRRR